MASVKNVCVYGLASTIYRSGYPMMDKAPDDVQFGEAVKDIEWAIVTDTDNPHVKRAIKLANAKGGGHDQFLTGIIVNFDLCISNKAWVGAERYTFLNFISSMSTMHRISKLPICDCCNEFTQEEAIRKAEQLQWAYNSIDGTEHPEAKKEAYLKLLYNLPSGFELTAAMTTNYRCLKNIYAQRRNHRLPDWKVVCDWIETLPMAAELITGKVGKDG